ncbi:MAG TPA: chemotaxis protein CheW [Longimicrobium sp.]|uniref:chemotaxis protein CheW n=1 Tax=Longimicrobium sp. TaxID=2029185 RepID=UPI002ED9FE2D
MRNVRQAAVPQVQLVTFKVGGEEFGLDVFAVHEIRRWEGVTPVPRMPAFVEGVLEVRGDVLPVIDLRRRFEVAGVVYDDDTRIVLVESEREKLGLVVDSVTEVLRAPETSISAPPAYIRGLAAEFVKGIVRLESRLVILLDLERILSSDERIALEGAQLVPAAEDGAAGGA